VWSIHLRLGINIRVGDYVTDRKIDLPSDLCRTNGPYIAWDYRKGGDKFDSYFNFPTPFDGSLYNAWDLLDLMNNGKFEKIILFEAMICHNGRQELSPKNYLVAPPLSECVTMQYNSSHTYGFRTNHHFNKSLQELNNQYLSGKTIDISSMDFSNVDCPHGEIPFTWKDY
jgi:hypothetical protein